VIRKRGFTLIELLVVLVLISLVSAFVAPRIVAPISNLQLKTASKKIAGAMRYSRSRAVSEKDSRLCLFDFDNQRLLIFSQSAFESAPPEEALSDNRAEIAYEMPENVLLDKAAAGDIDVTSGLFQIIFYSNGSASGGEVILINDRERSARIQVDFITGMVSLGAVEYAG